MTFCASLKRHISHAGTEINAAHLHRNSRDGFLSPSPAAGRAMHLCDVSEICGNVFFKKKNPNSLHPRAGPGGGGVQGGFMSVNGIVSCPTLKEASTCRPEGQTQTDRRRLTDVEEADTQADPQRNLSLC